MPTFQARCEAERPEKHRKDDQDSFTFCFRSRRRDISKLLSGEKLGGNTDELRVWVAVTAERADASHESESALVASERAV